MYRFGCVAVVTFLGVALPAVVSLGVVTIVGFLGGKTFWAK